MKWPHIRFTNAWAQVVVLGVGDELAQLDPAVDVGPLADLAAVEERREGDPDQAVALVEAGEGVGRLVGQLGVVVDLGAGGVGRRHVLGLDPLEEGVDAPEIGLLPVVRGMVVALGALDLLAEEDAGRDRGQGDRARIPGGRAGS